MVSNMLSNTVSDIVFNNGYIIVVSKIVSEIVSIKVSDMFTNVAIFY